MPKCAYCGTMILLGGRKEGDQHFCNHKCYADSVLQAVADKVPEDELQRRVQEIHQGPCPDCGGSGPVDVHTSYRVWSVVVVTDFSSRPRICCRACGARRKVWDAVYCLVLGWWGFPWGIVMTPVQIARNLGGLFASDDGSKPSPGLERMVRSELVSQMALAEVGTQPAG